MAKIIGYEVVTQTLLDQGLRSLYYNSGSFGFPPGVETHTFGWIGRPDPTIRPQALGLTRAVPPPFEQNLTDRAVRAWKAHLPGVVWVMPRAHWAYELDFGSHDWMPMALQDVGINTLQLSQLAHGAAIEFSPEETHQFASFLAVLLDSLCGSSDFQLIWPGRPVLCTVHHHKQLWWTSTDRALLNSIAAMQ